MRINLDMDGVIADFDRFFFENVGKMSSEFDSGEAAWAAISAHPDIYQKLEQMTDARELVEGCQKLAAIYGCTVGVLTAIPKKARLTTSTQCKITWLEKNFPHLIPEFRIGPFAEHKHNHCMPGDVLIDDKARNIAQWWQKGGFGIYHKTAKASLELLAAYLKELNPQEVQQVPKAVPVKIDTRPICSADGCSQREPCGPYCRDNGNFK